MAENKKSFLLYADLIHTVEKVSDEKAGQLLKIILAYVNDKDPQVHDLVLQLLFEPIRQQLKRDLERWEAFKAKQADNGRLGGRGHKSQTKPEKPGLSEESQKSPNVTVTVNDTVTVTKEKKDKSFVKPDFKEVHEYMKEYTCGEYAEADLKQQAQKFLDSNETKGWIVGKAKSPMKDWKGAVRYWIGNIPLYSPEIKKVVPPSLKEPKPSDFFDPSKYHAAVEKHKEELAKLQQN